MTALAIIQDDLWNGITTAQEILALNENEDRNGTDEIRLDAMALCACATSLSETAGGYGRAGFQTEVKAEQVHAMLAVADDLPPETRVLAQLSMDVSDEMGAEMKTNAEESTSREHVMAVVERADAVDLETAVAASDREKLRLKAFGTVLQNMTTYVRDR